MIEAIVNIIHIKVEHEKEYFINQISVDVIKSMYLNTKFTIISKSFQWKRLKQFSWWYKKNCILLEDNDKKQILKTFNFSLFTEDQIIEVIDIFTKDEIVDCLLKIIRDIRKEI